MKPMKEMKNVGKGDDDMGILGVLTIIFIVLKLLGVIDWSWFLVFAPGIMQIAIIVLAVIYKIKKEERRFR